jgi:hypothetical protein
MHVVLRDVTDEVNKWSADLPDDERSECEARIKELALSFFRLSDGQLNEANWAFAKPHSEGLYALVDGKIVITLDEDNKLKV